MDAQLVLFEDDTVAIDTMLLSMEKLEKKYDVAVVEVYLINTPRLSSWPTDRGLSWK